MKTELISFYSDIDDNTYYSDHAKRLKVQCDSLNIPTDFRHLDSLNDYRLNCLRKPKFILSVLEEKKKPIVWMDIDTEIHKELVVFDTIVEGPGDIGFAYTAMNREQLNPLAPKASPIFLKYNEIVLEFMNMWIDECQKSIDRNETFFDHEILLFKVLPFMQKKIKIACLPIEYCVWPGRCPSGIEPYITMGIAGGKSKEDNLRKLSTITNMSEHDILFNLNKV
jgi:hypothetical protein